MASVSSVVETREETSRISAAMEIVSEPMKTMAIFLPRDSSRPV